VSPIESNSVIPDNVESAVERALETLESLALLGEDVEDEWQYVQDLAGTWRARLESVAEANGSQPVEPAVGAAVARVCDEAALLDDPHRAIDWLSTFPQVVLSALGERP
jgi:hypothetical protein